LATQHAVGVGLRALCGFLATPRVGLDLAT
jgi:hypothetical protein